MQRKVDAQMVDPAGGGAHCARKLEDQTSDDLGLLDVHEVPGAFERHEPRARRQIPHDVLGLRAPTHLLVLETEHAQERHCEARQPHERPLRTPRTEPAEAHRRIELPAPSVGVVASADRDDVAQPVERKTRVHAATALGELIERARTALRVDAATAMVEPRFEVLGEEPRAFVVGDVGREPLRWQPVEVREVADAMGHRLGELHHQAAALRVADDGHRRPRGAVEHGERVAHVGVP